jgi:hypothetical protein
MAATSSSTWKVLRLMGYIPSVEVSHLLRLIGHARAYEWA